MFCLVNGSLSHLLDSLSSKWAFVSLTGIFDKYKGKAHMLAKVQPAYPMLSTAKGNHTWNENRGLLKILQVHLGREGAANNLALQYAFENQCDILLVQEPWIGADLNCKMAKKQVKYQA